MGAHAMDGELSFVAELSVAVLTDEAVVIGAFGRAIDDETRDTATRRRQEQRVVRRVSGGPPITVGKGSIHVLLTLARPQALTPCHAGVLVNRYVRPLLRALTKVGATAHYFGRDWVSVMSRPAGEVLFAHDATT